MKLKNFNISWFATVLGSAGMALTSLPYYPQLTLVLTYILTLVFAVLTSIWIAKIFLFIATILFLRLINHELLPSELAPTNFIHAWCFTDS